MAEQNFDYSRSPPVSDPSMPSESTSATSVSVETLSDSDGDIFDTSDDYEDHSANNNAPRIPQSMLSDLPAMQRQHMTAGYREGLSGSKAKSMQGGFDQGYPIGFELGIKVGQILGVLEGFLAPFAKDATKMPKCLVELYRKAKKELAISQLLDGLDDEKLADRQFGIEDLPVKATETVKRWEDVVAEMMKS